MQDFRTLKVWQAAHKATLEVYRVTRGYPREEFYGLTRQSRESASSMPTNIAEGCGRASSKEFGRFLDIAAGSASELEYQLILGRDLEYLPLPDYERLAGQVSEVKRMLCSLIGRVRPSDRSGPQVSKQLKTDN